ncbi:Ig-like domain-containing protein [Halococcus hamelinensis]|uniref:Putative cell surface protein n=1 Tax=Halococcus hamelinensis 100A6 TaxID=1132509 RepID=M0M6T6_9EURY|nr:Ig-like domain-containing protein [Halococcus hamelinensis]EMA41108.1 putative cell surface protein [Halococcus hamelinensis 100A6]
MKFQLRSGRSIAILAVAVAMVVAVGALAGGVTGQTSGTTQAPDLQSVGDFEYDAGNDTTNVTFSFDEEVDLTSSGGNFRLVPTDGGTDIGGQNVGGNGTANLSVEYSGQVTESDVARGVVQQNTVRVAGEGDETNNPTQAADVSNDGNSADPDLVNVTVNESTNSLIYAFDEPVSVESDSGFEAYAENATTMGGSVATDSLTTPTLVSVTFDQYDVSEVVGAAVTEGTVSNASDSNRTNSLDGVTVSDESPPAFSKCGGSGTDDTGDAGNASGPTQAPDLVGIDNVTYRQNPEDTNCQTLVEFDFDEPVNTQGGAGNFQLVPIDGGQTYDGNNEIVGERTNTTSLTVPFDGRIDPSTIARGFVDANTVRTMGENDSTLNPKQAADLNNDGNTANPDLVSITRSSAPDGALLYEFDEEVGEVGDTSGFNFYDGTGTETDAQEVATTDDPTTLSVSFEEGANVSTTAVGGSVDANAVVGTDTTREDGDVNQPDEVEITGNESIQCGNATTVENGSGPTAAPDLEAIDGFCTGNLASINGQQTFVNFTFDQPVDIRGGAGNFQLVPVDSTDFENQLFDGQGEVVAGNGTKTVTVAFAENVTQSDVARGFVDADTVAALDGQSPPTNPKQAADVSNDGNTANPDLVSVSPGGTDQLRFEFDEEITEPGDTSGFNFYDANGTEVDAQNLNRTNDSSVISVYFEPQANVSENAVGGSVDANAVVGTETTREDGDVNQPDEVELDGSSGPAPVGSATDPPTDPDGDGKYEDVNGDGSLTQADAQVLFANLDSLQGDSAFDFDDDGSVTRADAQALYDEWADN